MVRRRSGGVVRRRRGEVVERRDDGAGGMVGGMVGWWVVWRPEVRVTLALSSWLYSPHTHARALGGRKSPGPLLTLQ